MKNIFNLFLFVFLIFFLNINLSNEKATAQSRLTFLNTYSTSGKFSCSDFTYSSFRSAITNNSTGYCVGRATKYQITIRKIELGTSSGYNATGSNKRCQIFSGTMITDIGGASPDQTLGSAKPTWENCIDGTVYDRLYITVDRKFIFAANATFPTSTGSFTARTTSACATDSITSVTSNLTWLETNTDNTGSTCYVRTATTSSDVFTKSKADGLAGESDYSAMTSNVDNEYDDFKGVFLDSLTNKSNVSTANYISSDSTFYNVNPSDTPSYEGEKIDSTDSSREIMLLINGSDVISGNGFGVAYNSAKDHSIEVNYYAGNQTKGYGVRFLFKRVDTGAVTDVKILGARPDDNGIYITYNQN
jgi:hypothetical protein